MDRQQFNALRQDFIQKQMARGNQSETFRHYLAKQGMNPPMATGPDLNAISMGGYVSNPGTASFSMPSSFYGSFGMPGTSSFGYGCPDGVMDNPDAYFNFNRRASVEGQEAAQRNADTQIAVQKKYAQAAQEGALARVELQARIEEAQTSLEAPEMAARRLTDAIAGCGTDAKTVKDILLGGDGSPADDARIRSIDAAFAKMHPGDSLYNWIKGDFFTLGCETTSGGNDLIARLNKALNGGRRLSPGT